MMQSVVIDDDAMSVEIARKLIESTPGVELKKTFEDSTEATTFLMEEAVDLIFLDVEMPNMSGLDVIKSLDNPPGIILMTAHEQYALEAFDLNVIDYLMKPLDRPRFFKSIQKAKKRLQGDNASEPQSSEHLYVKKNNAHVRVKVSDICWIESDADYINIYTDYDRYMANSTMSAILEKLPEQQFQRVHRSYIVRLDKIESLKDNMIVINDKVIPVSRSYKQKLTNRMQFL
jgi:DNA-binding LytR/AlgR family response regulator